MAPGAYDALTALLVEKAGFDAVYATGFGASASLFGLPDVGLLTGSEMADHARRLVGAVNVPVIADADTGYGNAINVRRTVRDYERAGVSAIQLEDQVAPKRCGHMTDKAVIPTKEMVGKIKAALDARVDADTIIIARTDALATDGLDEAMARALEYRTAGADLIFVEAPTSATEVEALATHLADVPLMYNWVEGGRSPALSLDDLTDLGFALVIFPIGALLAATQSAQNYYQALRADGSPRTLVDSLPTFSEFTELVGLPELQELAVRYD